MIALVSGLAGQRVEDSQNRQVSIVNLKGLWFGGCQMCRAFKQRQ